MRVIMDEIWKDINGYEGLYQVSNFGRIKRLPYVMKLITSTGKLVKKSYKNFYVSFKERPDSICKNKKPTNIG